MYDEYFKSADFQTDVEADEKPEIRFKAAQVSEQQHSFEDSRVFLLILMTFLLTGICFSYLIVSESQHKW